MLECTKILQGSKTLIKLDSHIDLKKSIQLARLNGYKGKLQIEYSYQHRDENEETIVTLYCINSENKIIGAIHPFHNNKEVKKYV